MAVRLCCQRGQTLTSLTHKAPHLARPLSRNFGETMGLVGHLARARFMSTTPKGSLPKGSFNDLIVSGVESPKGAVIAASAILSDERNRVIAIPGPSQVQAIGDRGITVEGARSNNHLLPSDRFLVMPELTRAQAEQLGVKNPVAVSAENPSDVSDGIARYLHALVASSEDPSIVCLQNGPRTVERLQREGSMTGVKVLHGLIEGAVRQTRPGNAYTHGKGTLLVSQDAEHDKRLQRIFGPTCKTVAPLSLDLSRDRSVQAVNRVVLFQLCLYWSSMVAVATGTPLGYVKEQHSDLINQIVHEFHRFSQARELALGSEKDLSGYVLRAMDAYAGHEPTLESVDPGVKQVIDPDLDEAGRLGVQTDRTSEVREIVLRILYARQDCETPQEFMGLYQELTAGARLRFAST